MVILLNHFFCNAQQLSRMFTFYLLIFINTGTCMAKKGSLRAD